MILCLTVAIFSAKGWVVAGDKNEIAEHNFRLALPTSSPPLLAVQFASHVDHPLRPNPAVVNLLCVATETQIRDLTPAVEKELEFVVRDPQHSQTFCFSDVSRFCQLCIFSSDSPRRLRIHVYSDIYIWFSLRVYPSDNTTAISLAYYTDYIYTYIYIWSAILMQHRWN